MSLDWHIGLSQTIEVWRLGLLHFLQQLMIPRSIYLSSTHAFSFWPYLHYNSVHWFLVPIGIISTIQTLISAFYLLIHTSKQVSFYLLWAYRHRQLIRVEPPDKIFSKHLNDFYLSTLYQVYSIFSVGKIKKKFPSSRIWTSDLWITLLPLQSTALPTELSTVGR